MGAHRRCSLLIVLALVQCAVAQYSSLIKPLVRSVYWQVSNEECTAVHVLNTSTGNLVWKRSPVDHDQSWSTQVTDKKGFYTLQTGGPSATAVALESGDVRWAWPQRVGFAFWRKWNTSLPQTAQLDTPLPSISTQQVILRAAGINSKVIAVDMVNGSLIWEIDTLANITLVAADAGVPPPQRPVISAWRLDGLGTLFVAVTTHHPPPDAPGGWAAQYARHAAGTQVLQAGWRDSNGTDPSGGDDVDSAVALGWLLAVDLVQGNVRWVAGPLEQGLASLTLSEPALLAASAPDAAGSTWLFGMDKDTGALQYSLACGSDPCTVQVTDTRLGVLTAGLLQQPPVLDTLAAFDLVTGKVLWRGLSDSRLAPLVQGGCTAFTAPRLHLYFACTCAAPSDRSQAIERSRSAGQDTADPVWAASNAGGGHIGRPRPRPHPQPGPDPAPGPGLCAFSVTTQTGKLGFEVVLSATDAVPSRAAQFGLTPLALADQVVFPGVKAVYSMHRVTSTGPDGPPPEVAVTQGSVDEATRAMGDADEPRAQQRRARARTAAAGGSLAALRSATQAGQLSGVSSALHAAQGQRPVFSHAQARGLQEAPAPARPLFVFPLPKGVIMQPWDWLDLRGSSVLVHASPTPPDFEPLVTGDVPSNKPRLMQSWVYSIDTYNGSLQWSTPLDVSEGSSVYRPLPHDWGRGGLLLVDGCQPPGADSDSGGAANGAASWHKRGSRMEDPMDAEDGDGTACKLYAISLRDGHVAWERTFDLDRACGSGLKRRTATTIVYILLCAQVVVLLAGCVMGIVWGRHSATAHGATYMHDPDSEEEALIVHVLPTPTQPQ